MKKMSKYFITILSFLILGGFIIFSLFHENTSYPKIKESQVFEKLEDINSVMVSNNEYLIKTTDGTFVCKPNNSQDFIQKLYDNNIKCDFVEGITYKSPITKLSEFLITFFVVFLIISIIRIIFFYKNVSKSIQNMTKKTESNEKMDFSKLMGPDVSLNISREIPNVKFENIQGCKELKKDAQGLISYLQNPYKYQLMGARMPKGVILYGPPGTGKTLMAKAIAGEAKVPILSVSGSSFAEMYVGVGAKRVRELFDTAQKIAPCIIFIDEIDAIGGKRGHSQNSEKDQTINELLTQMDGFNGSKGIMVIATTNRLDILDPAVIRAGRFDKHLAVPLPDKDDRYNILKLHSKNKKLDESVDLKVLANQTTGFSGAELESLLNEATLIAVNNDKKFVSNKEIDRAFFKITMQGDIKEGQDKRKEKELKLVAWHEAGHTLITKLLTNDEVTRVTILSSTSGAGGVTFHNPPEGEFYSKQDLKNRIAICYGGRAAEEILFGSHDEVTVGASSDIQSASKMIKDYIMKYGMSEKFGMLDISAFDYQSMSNDDLINEASNLANEIYEYTLNTLKSHKDILQKVAQALLEKENLLDKDINDLMGIEASEEKSLTLETV